MSAKQPTYRITVAIILGFFIIATPEMEPTPWPLALISLAFGSLLGFLWPANSWKWGLWIAAPSFVLVGLSVAFAGNIEIFLRKDLPLMLMMLASTCIGSLAGTWIKRSRTTE